jgi:anti-sigma regulatory factor (Ser/Thr protein kinase)
MQMCLAPAPGNVRVARDAVSEYAAVSGMDERRLGDVGLAVSEAVTNAFAAQRAAGTSTWVLVGAQADGDSLLEVTVSDTGNGFVPLSEQQCQNGAARQTGSTEGGFGVTVMRALASDIDFHHDRGTTVRMRFVLTEPEATPD